MINKIKLLCVFSLICGCTLDIRHEPTESYGPPPYTENVGSSYVEATIYESYSCYEDPYWYSEEWCEYYDDGAMCCVWLSDGWYEEYCQWGYDYCWEYNGSF